MSGGYFNYDQYRISQIADQVEQLILSNDSEELDEWGTRVGHHYPPEVIEEFRRGLTILRQAFVYAQRIDWLVSGDDGPDTFRDRLAEDLSEIKKSET